MKLGVDMEADALILRLDEPRIDDSHEVSPWVVLDFDTENEVVSVEIHQLSSRSSELDLSSLLFKAR